jgi:fumarate reductase flavoprotein subunit
MDDTDVNDALDTFDLIIVGGGLAGLVAGVRARELGLRTMILEKGDGEDYPCNSRHSGGILHIAFHDPFRPVAELSELITRLTSGDARPDLAAALAGNAARLITWLQEHGARFMRFNPQEGYRWCMAPPRALRAGSDWRNRGPDVVLRHLTREFVDRGGTLQLRTRATRLLTENGACTGIAAECDGQTRTWKARHCLIADGGFQSNPDLFAEHIGSNFAAIFQRGAATGMGDGLRMACEAGAALTGTNRFYGHLLCADARHNDQIWPYPEMDAIATAGVVIDESGSRIADEGRGGVYLTNALAALPGRRNFFAIFDAAIWEGPGKSARIPANPLLESAGGTVFRADSIEELAGRIGVPAEILRRTVDEYDTALDAGTLGELAIPRSQNIAPQRIATPPFMAIALMPGITYTMGGLVIDEHAQALDVHGEPIPGLLAAGAATGGIEGGRNATYIGGLIKAGTFGMIAAERVATLLGKAVTKPEPQNPGSPGASSPSAGPAEKSGETGGLSRYPFLRATLKYGKAAALLLALVAGFLTSWIAWPAFGALALAPALLIAGIVVVAILSYVELVSLITELLVPD